MPYSNGRVPSTALTEVEPGNWLQHAAARSLSRLKAAAKTAGYTVWVIDPDGAYRDRAVQQDMHVHPSRHNIDPTMSVRLAAVGYSTHGFALAADLAISGGTAGFTWLLQNAPRFGWTRTFGAADPHHFGWDGHTAGGVVVKRKPAKQLTVQAQHGDTLAEIADDTDTTVAAILKLNPSIANPNRITAGQKIRVR